MDRNDWDERYQGENLVWSAEPNRFLVAEIDGSTPGRALDGAAARAATRSGSPTKAGRSRGSTSPKWGWTRPDVWPRHEPCRRRGRSPTSTTNSRPRGVPSRDRPLSPPGRGAATSCSAVRRRRWRRRDPARRGPRQHQPHSPAGAAHVTPGCSTDRKRSPPTSRGLDIVKATRVERHVSTDEGDRIAIDTLVRAHSAHCAASRDPQPFPSPSSATTWSCRASTAPTGPT